MKFSTVINWTSPFPFKALLGGIFIQILTEHFVSKLWRPRLDAAASDLGLYCLRLSHKKDDRLIWVKQTLGPGVRELLHLFIRFDSHEQTN